MEEVFEQVLALQEEGMTREEILASMSEQKNEVMEIFVLMAKLKKTKEKIVPPRALLEKIVAKIEPVITGAEQRYNKQRVGRLSLINILINKNFNLMSWRVVAPAGIIAIVLAVFVLAEALPGENKAILKIAKQAFITSQNESATSSGTKEKNNEPESIDSIINSLFDDSVSEQTVLDEEDADASLLVADSLAMDQVIDQEDQAIDQEINNFNQT